MRISDWSSDVCSSDLIEVDTVVDGVVSVRMLGTCDGCPSSSATLTYGVEEALREHWPNFRRLELVDAPAEADPAKADLTCGTARSEERRGGKGCVSTCHSRRSPYHEKKTKNKN